jgi:phosphate uptake regulator
MLKALLIVTSLSGVHDYSVEMPTMEECLATRTVIEEQDSDIKTLCIPTADESQKMQEVFNLFLDMMEQLRQDMQDNIYHLDDEVTRLYKDLYEESVDEFRECTRCLVN